MFFYSKYKNIYLHIEINQTIQQHEIPNNNRKKNTRIKQSNT